MNYVTGSTIKKLREKKKLTQKQLADLLQVSDKTVSKWKTDRGLPDISLMGSLASVLLCMSVKKKQFPSWIIICYNREKNVVTGNGGRVWQL